MGPEDPAVVAASLRRGMESLSVLSTERAGESTGASARPRRPPRVPGFGPPLPLHAAPDESVCLRHGCCQALCLKPATPRLPPVPAPSPRH
jgi:hypothetical protein